MKIKTILACLLALVLAMPANDAYAQTRKKGTGTRKTATTGSKRSTTTKTAAAKTLNQEELGGAYFEGRWMMGLEKVGKDVGIYFFLYLKADGTTFAKVVGADLNGDWSVSGTTLSVTSGNLRLKLTTTDGFTFKGNLTKNGSDVGPVVFYKVEKGKYDIESLKKGFNKGSFQALMEVRPPKGELLFPVEFKTTPNADGTGGTYKISVDNALGLGLIKGTYTFTENSVKFTSNLDDCDTDEAQLLDDRKELFQMLGKKYIDGSGKSKVYLYLLGR